MEKKPFHKVDRTKRHTVSLNETDPAKMKMFAQLFWDMNIKPLNSNKEWQFWLHQKKMQGGMFRSETLQAQYLLCKENRKVQMIPLRDLIKDLHLHERNLPINALFEDLKNIEWGKYCELVDTKNLPKTAEPFGILCVGSVEEKRGFHIFPLVA